MAKTLAPKAKKDAPLQLGCEVRDVISGIVGIATGRTEWLTGCDTIVVEPKAIDGKKQDYISVDIKRLEVTREPIVLPDTQPLKDGGLNADIKITRQSEGKLKP